MTKAERIPCEQCKQLADPVHRVAPGNGEQLFRGWFCAHCGHLTKPVGRERNLEPPTKQ